MQYGSLLKNKDDRTKQLPWLPHKHDFKIVIGEEVPDMSLTTSAHILPFKGEDILLANVHSRGWDIPGGHLERGETHEEAVARELFEETGAKPLYMGYLGYMEINVHGEVPPPDWRYPFPTTYLAFYWGVVEGAGEPSASMEVGPPKFFPPAKAMLQESLQRHEDLYKAALERAQAFAEAYK